MIENRSRIERQILLGRQAVRKAHKNRSRTAPHKSDVLPLIQNKAADGTIKPTLGALAISPAPSGSDIPLSVDTDDETAFARRSPLLKRGRTSKTPSLNRPEGTIAGSSRRRARVSEFKTSPEPNNTVNVPPTPQASTEVQSSGFFSRLRTNSLSKLSLPFSYDRREPKQSTSEHPHEDTTWSSESSSEGYSLLDEDFTLESPSNPVFNADP